MKKMSTPVPKKNPTKKKSLPAKKSSPPVIADSPPEIKVAPAEVEWITPALPPASVAVPEPAQPQSFITKILWTLTMLILGAATYAVYSYATSSTLQSHLTTSAKINIGLKQELGRLKDEAVQSQKIIGDYENTIKELTASESRAAIQLTELKEQADALREERQSLKVKVPRLEQNNEKQNAEIDSLRERVTLLDKEVVPINELNKKLQIAQNEGLKYKKEALRLGSELTALQERVKGSQEQRRTDLIAEKNRSQVSIEEEKKAAQRNRAQLEDEIKKLKSDLEISKAKIKEESEKNLALHRQSKKDVALALQELSRSSTTKNQMIKETAAMHYNLGVIFLQNKNYQKSVQEFEKVLSMRPDDADAHYNLALIYDEQLPDNARAISHYRAYLKIRPDAEDAPQIQKWIIDKESIMKVQN